MFILHRNRFLLFYIFSPLGGGIEYQKYDIQQICKFRYTPNITLVFCHMYMNLEYFHTYLLNYKTLLLEHNIFINRYFQYSTCDHELKESSREDF